MIRWLTLSLLLLPAGASATASTTNQAFEIIRLVDSKETGANGSSGSSHDADALVARVIANEPDGQEIEYDLLAETPQRSDQWQFPARVFRPTEGPMQLRNRAELESRVDGWLNRNGMTRAACGHWLFTWNAFRIDCDPQSAIDLINAFDLGPEPIRENMSYQDANALAPAPLRRVDANEASQIYRADLTLDPEKARRARAESDVVVGEIMRKPVTLQEALRLHADEQISGTITTTFDTDASGSVRRRVKVMTIEVLGPAPETHLITRRTVTETIERRAIKRARLAS